MISSLSECQIAGVSVGVQITVREFENTEGHEIRFTDQSLVQYPWGMHICDYEEEKRKHKTRAWFSDVVCLWCPGNDSSLQR